MGGSGGRLQLVIRIRNAALCWERRDRERTIDRPGAREQASGGKKKRGDWRTGEAKNERETFSSS